MRDRWPGERKPEPDPGRGASRHVPASRMLAEAFAARDGSPTSLHAPGELARTGGVARAPGEAAAAAAPTPGVRGFAFRDLEVTAPATPRAQDAGAPAGLLQRLGDGAPLDGTMASAAGETYGADLSNVRIHTGPAAARVADEHGARAFTIGSHIGFGAGQYNPGTPIGDAIMAHELAHVVQQHDASPAAQAGPIAADRDAGAEGEADQAAGGVLARLYGGAGKLASRVAGRLGTHREVSLQRCARTPDRIPPLPAGEEHAEWSVDKFVAIWEKQHKREMTEEEKLTLAHGCIGITALNLGRGNYNPPLGLSFSTFAQARQVQQALNDILAAKPLVDELGDLVDAHPVLKDLKNVLASMPVDPDPAKWRAVIFSKRFFSRQTGTWEERRLGDPTKFQPDAHGQVDMSEDRNIGRADVNEGPGNYMINFDYGWWDEATDSWLHANHAEPGMKVYQSTLSYYSRPLRNFDRQIFCVAFARIDR